MEMYTDVRGEAYDQLIDLAIRKSEYFVLFEQLQSEGNSAYIHVLKALEPYLERTIEIPVDNRDKLIHIQNTYQSHAFYSAGIYYLYRCCVESGNILKQCANRLSDWISPNLPEDLCFIKQGGGDFLLSVVHESLYHMDISEEEAIELMDRITGVFFKLKAHEDLDRLLDDAIKHKTDKLYISGHKLTELPERIRELTELRDLEIFEQDLFQLPDALFELSKLERLTIMTADLEGIPAAIVNLKKLRELSIMCGSSDRPTPDFQVKPREEICLNSIPAEIGELNDLEILSLQYTAIDKLPREITKLKHMKQLNLNFESNMP